MQKIRVLVVDDEIPFLNRLLQVDWDRLGCVCAGSATNGRDALELCRQLAPQLVITDINMPLMDGIQLMETIRNEFPDIKIILLTVLESFAFARKAVEFGAIGYVVKSVDFTDALAESLAKARSLLAADNGKYTFSEEGVLRSKTGRVIQLPPGNDPREYGRELERLVAACPGTLITVRSRLPLRKLPLAGEWDDWLAGLQDKHQSLAMILHSPELFEILVTLPGPEARAWFSKLLQAAGNPFGLQPEQCRLASRARVATLDDYFTAHQLNLAAIRQGFYQTNQSAAETDRSGAFSRLPAAQVSEWMRKLEIAGSRYDKIEQYIRGDILPAILRGNFEPDDVSGAFVQLARHLEFLYAARADHDQVQSLAAAWTLRDLVDLFLTRVRGILGQDGNYCYEVKAAIAYMRTNLSKPDLGLAEVAGQVNISVGYLSKLIKEATGETYKEMLIRLRMEHAAHLLRTTSARVYELAEQTGYQNYRSFAKAFADFHGVNPKKFGRQ